MQLNTLATNFSIDFDNAIDELWHPYLPSSDTIWSNFHIEFKTINFYVVLKSAPFQVYDFFY